MARRAPRHGVRMGEGTRVTPIDLHLHTTFSDGDLAPADVLALAQARAVFHIGIADHVSRNSPKFLRTADAVAHYLAALEPLPVWRGAEFCWLDELWRTLPAVLLDRLDYRIGSNHAILLPDGALVTPWSTELPPGWEGRAQELMDRWVDELCRLVRTMPIDILGHGTTLPPALLAREPEIDAWWTEEREDRLLDALAERGVALEISNRYRVPHRRLLVKAKQRSVRFSLGSDGHRPDQIACLDWARAEAAAAGLDENDLFRPARPLPLSGSVC